MSASRHKRERRPSSISIGLGFTVYGFASGYRLVVVEPPRILSRGVGAGARPAAIRLTRTPRGHPEGWIEAWANLYAEFSAAIDARRRGRVLPQGTVDFPTVADGARGVQFIDAAVRSSAAGGAFVELPEDMPGVRP
jgi:hypothetical protein